MMGISENIQEAVTSLIEADTVEHLIELFKLAISTALTTVLSVEFHVCPLDSGLFDECPVKLTLAREAIQREQRIVENFSVSRDNHVNSTSTFDCDMTSKIVCSPLADCQSEVVIGVSVIVCCELSEDFMCVITFLERQFLACYRRLKKSMSKMILPSDSLMHLCASLHDPDAVSLQLKVLKFLQQQTEAETAFLLLVDSECQQMFCQAIGDKILDKEIIVPVKQSGFSVILRDKLPKTLNDIDTDHLNEILCHLDCEILSSACFPVICRVTGEVIAVLCLVNKRHCSDSFTDRDATLAEECFTYTASVLYSAIAVQHERKLKKHTESLLGCARNLFSHLEVLPELLKEIMQEAKMLTDAERCSVFLVDKKANQLVSEVFDSDINEAERKPIRLGMKEGIAGHVAMTGEILNIEDAYSHQLFFNGIDEETGFHTRNILSFPLKDPAGKVVGVAQLCNKIGGGVFTKFDEMIATGFSVLCSISVMHSVLYKKVKDSQARVQLSNELMMYHMQVVTDEVQSLVSAEVSCPTKFVPDIHLFTCVPRNIHGEDIPLAVISMMNDLGFIDHFAIPRDCLARFVLMAKRGYRDPPYHNWLHAFAVVHYCYLLLKNVPWRDYIDDIEALALFVACLCHDIDHRGTNNAYQKASGSLLHTLYSSEGSMLERHHFAQTMCVLNTDGCNIFENLSREDYIQILDLMQDIILATDIAKHMGIVGELQKMADEGYERSNKEHRKHLLRLMMTACDLSDQTKDFQTSHTVAELIYAEFFRQGDLEKNIGQEPMDFMDRERAIIPDLQIVFIDSIALPGYRILASVMPQTRESLHVVEQNRKLWTIANKELIDRGLPRNMGMFQHLPSIMDSVISLKQADEPDC